MPEKEKKPPAQAAAEQKPPAHNAPPEAAGKKAAAPEPAKTIADVLQSTQIALDNYDDIFSDFDSSPYVTRVLSDDFLQELRKRYAETQKGDLIVNFTLPASLRSEKTEILIRKRLKDYFRMQLAAANKNIGAVRSRGAVRIGAGLFALVPLIVFPHEAVLPINTLLSVFSWYLLWSGLDNLLEVPMKLMAERSFNEKFVRAKYNFVPEEDIARSIGGYSYR